ncbi:MAG: LuxR family transcriptional regulator [Candidatus Nanopelagicales bacterium]
MTGPDRGIPDSPTLVGRDVERARIGDLLATACAGSAGHLLLVGDPGIGKTALLQDATARAEALGARSVRITSTEPERDIPGAGLSLLAAALADAQRHLDPRPAAVLRETYRGVVSPAAAGAVLELLSTAAEPAPLLVALDDLHWCDRDSLRVVTFAVRRLAHEPVAVLLAGRHEVLLDPALAGLARLDVGPLDLADAVLLARSAHPALEPAVADRLAHTLSGNPLALLETIRRLEPAALHGPGSLPDPLPVGPAVADRWASEVPGLPRATRVALAVLAIDDSGSPSALARAWGAVGAEPADLVPAEQAGLVRLSGSRWQFRHPLARHACAVALPPATLRAAHSALADALGGTAEDPSGATGPERTLRRLWHRVAAAPGPDPALAAEVRSSAHALAQSGASSSASLLLERAADLVPSPHDRADLLAEAAAQALLDEDDERAIVLAERGLELGPDAVTRGRLLRARGVAAGRTRTIAEGRADLSEALDLLPQEERAHALLDLLFTTDNAADAHDALARVLDQMQDPDRYDPFGRLTITHAAFRLGRLEGGDVSRAWHAVDPTTGPLDGVRTETYFNAGMDVGLDVAAEGWGRLGARLRTSGSPQLRLEATSMDFVLDFYQGRWDEALDDVEESTALTLAIGRADLYGDSMRAPVLARRDDGEAFERAMAAAEIACGEAGMSFWLEAFPGERGFQLLTRGQAAEAAPLLERSALAAKGTITAHTVYADHVLAWVETLVDLGRDDEAREALEWLDARLGGTQATLGRGLRTRAHAALAGPTEVEALYLSAIEDISRGPHVFEAARTRLRYATWLRRRRRKAPAAQQAAAALATFESLGCGQWADRCRAELAAAGVDQVRGGRHDARRDLTAQERRVAAAVAEGLSNREIGQRLFLSPRTVEVHLGHVYRKLGLRGRSALVRWWSEREPTALAADP